MTTREKAHNLDIISLDRVELRDVSIVEGMTDDFIDLALSQLVRVLASATPEAQPSKEVLETYLELLKWHREGTPAKDFSQQLEELRGEIADLKTKMSAIAMGGGVRHR